MNPSHVGLGLEASRTRVPIIVGLALLPASPPGDERGVVVDEVVEREAAIEKLLDRLVPIALDVTAYANTMVRDLVDHLAVRLGEPVVLLEEVRVPVDVSHDQFLVHGVVALHQVGVARIIVDHELIDLREP